mgnify:CR=1 FL=1
MAKVAVIATGGKQYLVKPGDVVEIEKIEGKNGDVVQFDTLMTADESGSNLDLGKPNTSSKVKAKVLEQFRDDKITVIKFKAKTRYRRKHGHQQHKTKVQIESI